jgi:hypothetical protein
MARRSNEIIVLRERVDASGMLIQDVRVTRNGETYELTRHLPGPGYSGEPDDDITQFFADVLAGNI